MFPNHRNKNRGSIAFLILLVTASAMTCASASKKQGTGKKGQELALRGQVFANVYGLSDYLLVGEPGFNAKTFIFLIDSGDRPRKPVKISYQFFKQEPRLPDSFFSYSRFYELRVARDTGCDESFESLSNMQNEEAGTGKPLPPTKVLHILDGASKDIVKPDLVLPCYILTPGKYKVLTR